MAEGDGRPVVLTALGSGEKLFALVPLAMLSVASVAGLATMGNDDPAASASPAGSGMAAGSPGHETARHQAPARWAPSSARTAIAETASPVVLGESTSSDTVHEERTSMEEPATAGSPVEARVEPADRAAEEKPTAPVPTATPTAAPDPTDSGILSRAEATTRCLESGISAADVLGLAACVEDLLG